MFVGDSPCIISFGFIVSLRLFEMLCIVITRPEPFVVGRDDPFEIVDGNESSRIRYGLCGKAKRKAIAAKHISIQTKKFCQPEEKKRTFFFRFEVFFFFFTRSDRSNAQIRFALKSSNNAEIFENSE